MVHMAVRHEYCVDRSNSAEPFPYQVRSPHCLQSQRRSDQTHPREIRIYEDCSISTLKEISICAKVGDAYSFARDPRRCTSVLRNELSEALQSSHRCMNGHQEVEQQSSHAGLHDACVDSSTEVK